MRIGLRPNKSSESRKNIFYLQMESLSLFLPGAVDEILRDAPLCHLVLDVAERGVVLAEVVGHVAVGVDGEQVRAAINKELYQVEMAAGGGSVKGRPLLGVGGVCVAAVFD
jgi:hypothetical protein